MTLRRYALVVLAVAGGLALCSCHDASPHSSAGFRLPAGDPDAGRMAFVKLECHTCHRVDGAPELPAPTAEPPVPVVLGGRVPHVKTDGELVTSIINPSHQVARGYAPQGVQLDEGLSRMPSYRDVMTVSQLVDVVAWLQTRYEVVRPGR